MEKRDLISKILAVMGTASVWFAILTPFLFTATRLMEAGSFLFDFLMPAEMFPLPLTGGILLMLAALRARSQWRWIGCSLGVFTGTYVGALVLAQVTGLASGATEPASLAGAAVLALFGIFWLALIALGIGGVLALREIFAKPPPTAEA
jgi:hypothetical protein